MRTRRPGLICVLSLLGGAFLACATARADMVSTPPPEMLKLRDPFRRPEALGKELVQKTELETFSVDQLKMLGVATGPKHLTAMVLAPNSKTYFISMNTKVGLRKGVVTQITPELVRIREKVINVLGQEEDVESVIHLPLENPDGAVAGMTGGSVGAVRSGGNGGQND